MVMDNMLTRRRVVIVRKGMSRFGLIQSTRRSWRSHAAEQGASECTGAGGIRTLGDRIGVNIVHVCRPTVSTKIRLATWVVGVRIIGYTLKYSL